MKNFMFDTHVYDEIIDGRISKEQIEKSKKIGYRYFITHIQIDEISVINDSKKDRRMDLIFSSIELAQSLIPTETFVFDYSRLENAKLPINSYFERLLQGISSRTDSKIRDAIIGDTVLQNNFILVTKDRSFRNKIIDLGGRAISVDEFNIEINNIIP